MKIEVSTIQILYGIQRYADHDDGRRISAARLSNEISRMVGEVGGVGWGGVGGYHCPCSSNKKSGFCNCEGVVALRPPAIVRVWLRCAPTAMVRV